MLDHHPLPMHRHARFAAIAVQAAGRQGKAWALHDALFAHQRALSREDIMRYASDAGLDTARFTTDVGRPEIAAEVEADAKLAMSVGARGTPASFINGRPIMGAQPYEAFSRVVEDELRRAGELLAAGTPLGQIYDKRCHANIAAFAKAAR